MRWQMEGNIRYLTINGCPAPYRAHVINQAVDRELGESLSDFKARCKAVEAQLFEQYGTLEAIQKRMWSNG